MEEKLFELLCIENDLAKYFAKCHNLIFFFRKLRQNPQNDVFL